MSRASEIENADMIIHGEKAHSFYFGSDAYKKLTATPGANHTDLYDRTDIIPFAAIKTFFDEHLNQK